MGAAALHEVEVAERHEVEAAALHEVEGGAAGREARDGGVAVGGHEPRRWKP